MTQQCFPQGPRRLGAALPRGCPVRTSACLRQNYTHQSMKQFRVFLRKLWKQYLSSHLITSVPTPGSVSEVVPPALPASDWHLHPFSPPHPPGGSPDSCCLVWGSVFVSSGPEPIYWNCCSRPIIQPPAASGSTNQGSAGPQQVVGTGLGPRIFLAQDSRQPGQAQVWDESPVI